MASTPRRTFFVWRARSLKVAPPEIATLQAVSAATRLAPRPILCDAAGEIIGEPLFIVTMLEGAPLAPPDKPDEWTVQLADALIAIHEIPPAAVAGVVRDRSPQERLARRLADPPPEPDPLWDEVVRVMPTLADRFVGNRPTLIHSDFWFGNSAWRDGRLNGVLDWGDARIADPARDVAIARTDLRLYGGSAPRHCSASGTRRFGAA